MPVYQEKSQEKSLLPFFSLPSKNIIMMHDDDNDDENSGWRNRNTTCKIRATFKIPVSTFKSTYAHERERELVRKREQRFYSSSHCPHVIIGK